MPLHERGDVGRIRGLADGVGDVDRVEVAGREEAVDGLEPNVIGVDVIRLRPAERLDGGVGGGADSCPGSLLPTVGVFAMRLVPHWNDVGAMLRGPYASLELGPGLVGEAVADADRVFAEREHSWTPG